MIYFSGIRHWYGTKNFHRRNFQRFVPCKQILETLIHLMFNIQCINASWSGLDNVVWTNDSNSHKFRRQSPCAAWNEIVPSCRTCGRFAPCWPDSVKLCSFFKGYCFQSRREDVLCRTVEACLSWVNAKFVVKILTVGGPLHFKLTGDTGDS